MAQKSCMCQEAGVLIFPCSGGSDVGELSDRIARKMARCGQARMFCLAGVGAHVPGMVESAKAARTLIAIDGCRVSCAKKILEHAGFTPLSFNLRDMGFEKGKAKVDGESVENALLIIIGGNSEKTYSPDSGGGCGHNRVPSGGCC